MVRFFIYICGCTGFKKKAWGGKHYCMAPWRVWDDQKLSAISGFYRIDGWMDIKPHGMFQRSVYYLYDVYKFTEVLIESRPPALVN